MPQITFAHLRRAYIEAHRRVAGVTSVIPEVWPAVLDDLFGKRFVVHVPFSPDRGPFRGNPANLRVVLKGMAADGGDIVCEPCSGEHVEFSP